MFHNLFKKGMSILTLVTFLITGVIPSSYAQSAIALPSPGKMLSLTNHCAPALLKGMRVFPQDPLHMQFLVDQGEALQAGTDQSEISRKMIKYFLAGLTIPEKDLWVNLSPAESDRIMPLYFGETEMGRDLLAQDYLLKQLSASLIHPDSIQGKAFWQGVYEKAMERYGTTDIPTDVIHKIWIVPEKAVVYEKDGTAVIIESRLKVMLEADYRTAAAEGLLPGGREALAGPVAGVASGLDTTDILRDVLVPEIQKEVNEGEIFAPLRQIYRALVLAAWFRKKITAHVLNQVYTGQNRVEGIAIEDRAESKKIYAQYVEAFRQGVFNMIREELDPGSQEIIPRKYFSGGLDFSNQSTEILSYPVVMPSGATEHDGKLNITDIQLRPSDTQTVSSATDNGLARLISASGLDELYRDLSGQEALYSQMIRDIKNNVFDKRVSALELYGDIQKLDSLIAGMRTETLRSQQEGLAGQITRQYNDKITQLHQQNRVFLLIYLASLEGFRKLRDSKDMKKEALRGLTLFHAQGEIKLAEAITPETGDMALKLFTARVNQQKTARLDNMFLKTFAGGLFNAVLSQSETAADPVLQPFYQMAFENVVLDTPGLDIEEETQAALSGVLKSFNPGAFEEFLNKISEKASFVRLKQAVEAQVRFIIQESVAAWADGYMGQKPVLLEDRAQASDQAMLSSAGSLDKLIVHVDSLAADYHKNLGAMIKGMGPSYDEMPASELFGLMKKLERSYKRINARLKFYQSKNADNTLLSKAVKAYLGDIASAHESAIRHLKAYAHLSWKKSQQGSGNYLSLQEEIDNIWKTLVAENEQLADLKEKYENPAIALAKPWHHGNLKQGLSSSLKAVFAAKVETYFRHHFQATLYGEVVMDMLDKEPARAAEILASLGLSDIKDEAPVKKGLGLVIREYAPELVREKMLSLQDKVREWMGRDAQKKELLRSGRSVGKWTLFAAGIVFAAFFIFKEIGQLGKDGTLSKVGPKATTEAVSSDGQGQAVSQKPSVRTLFGRVRGAPIAISDSMRQKMDLRGVNVPQGAIDPRLQSQIEAFEKQLQELDRLLAEADKNMAETRATLQKTSQAVQKDLQSLEQRAAEFEEYKEPSKKNVEAPEKWNTPSEKKETSQETVGKEENADKEGAPEKLDKNIGLQDGGVHMGLGNTAPSEPRAQSNAGAYLATQQFNRVDIFSGRYFSSPEDFKLWEGDTHNGNFKEWVLVPSSGSRTVLAPVPPGYKIDGVKIEGEGGSYAVYHDAVNGAWAITFFDKAPGKVLLSVTQEPSLSNPGNIVFVDKNENPISDQDLELKLREIIPAPMWSVIEKARGLDLQQRRVVLNRLQSIFYYTTNPLLNTGATYFSPVFGYFAGHCEALTMVRIALAKALDVPTGVIMQGYLADGDVFSEPGHVWNYDDKGNQEATARVTGSSPNYGKKNIPKELWETEMSNLKSPEREKWIAESFKNILAEMDKAPIENEKKMIEQKKKELEQEKQGLKKTEKKAQDIPFADRKQSYQEITAGYQKILDEYGIEQAASEEKEFLLQSIELDQIGALMLMPNVEQLMGRAVFFYEVISRIESDTVFAANNRARINALKTRIAMQLRQKAAEEHWDLLEPVGNFEIQHEQDVRVRLDMVKTRSVNINGTDLNVYEDIYTGETVTVPVQGVFDEFHNGTYIIGRDDSVIFTGKMNKEVSISKENGRSDTYDIPSHPLDKNNFLVKRVFEDKNGNFFNSFSGPMAERSGIGGKVYPVGFKYAIIDNDILIKNDETGYFEGGLAKRLGLEGVKFEKSLMPIKVGNFYLTFVKKAGQSFLTVYQYDPINNTVIVDEKTGWSDFEEDSLEDQEGGSHRNITKHSTKIVKIRYKDGSWGYWGGDDDASYRRVADPKDLIYMKNTREGSEILCWKDMEGNYKLNGEWVDQQNEVRTKVSQFEFIDGKYIVDAMVEHSMRNFETHKLKDLWFVDQPHILFLDQEGKKWVIPVTLGVPSPGQETPPHQEMMSGLVGTSDVVEAFRNRRDLFVNSNHSAYFIGDDWMVPVTFLHKSGMALLTYYGPLVEKSFHELSVSAMVSKYEKEGKILTSVDFEKDKDGQIIPEKFISVFQDKEGRSVEGPLAEVLGLKGVNVGWGIIVTKDQDGKIVGTTMRGYWAQQQVDFMTRIVSRYHVFFAEQDGKGESSFQHIPSYRWDIRLKHMDLLLEQGQWPRQAFYDLLNDIRSGMDLTYFDRDAFETVFRKMFCNSVDAEASVEGQFELVGVLQFLGFEHLIVEMGLAMGQASDFHYSIEAGTPYQLSRAVKAYFEKKKEAFGLPLEIISPEGVLNEKDLDLINTLNALYLEFSSDTALMAPLKEFDKQIRADLDTINRVIPAEKLPADSMTPDKMTRVMSRLHELVGLDMPFDVEVSADVKSNLVYRFLQNVYRQEWSFLKVGSSGYSHRYAMWQDANERLNKVLGKDYNGQGDISVLKAFLGEAAHDGPTLFLVLMAMIYASNMVLRKTRAKDLDLWATDPEDVIRKMWENNPWFDGDSEGGIESAKEFLKEIMAGDLRVSDEQLAKLGELSESLDEHQRAILQGILLVATGRPVQETEVGNRLWGFIPVLGATLMRKRPNTRKWQEFNKALLEWTGNISKETGAKEAYLKLEDILHAHAEFAKEEDDKNNLSAMPDVDEFRGMLKDAFFDQHKVIVNKQQKRISGPNGTYTRSQGDSMDILELDQYGEGMDIRKINQSATARTGRFVMNKTAEEALVPSAIVMDIRRITRGNAEQWASELVSSIKALYKSRSLGPQRTDEWLSTLLFLMPDGKIETVKTGLDSHQPRFEDVSKRVMIQVMKRYELVHETRNKGQLREVAETLTGFPFYQDEQNAAYKKRVKEVLRSDGLNGVNSKLRQHIPVAIRFGTFYLVGCQKEYEGKVRNAFRSAVVFTWDKNKAVEVTATRDHSESLRKDKLGGVDLRGASDTIEMRGEAFSMNVTAFSESLKDAPGFMPVIIDMRPVEQVSDFLAVQ